MNPEIKKLWVDALRSGEYKQGHGVLRRGNTYCCLGVICDLHSKTTGTKWVEAVWPDDSVPKYLGASNALPFEVIDWAGLNSSNPMVTGRYISLAGANDDGATFAQIADLIEAYI